VQDMALDVMRHRIILSYEALSEGITSEVIIGTVLKNVPAPAVLLEARSDAQR